MREAIRQPPEIRLMTLGARHPRNYSRHRSRDHCELNPPEPDPGERSADPRQCAGSLQPEVHHPLGSRRYPPTGVTVQRLQRIAPHGKRQKGLSAPIRRRDPKLFGTNRWEAQDA